MGLFQKPKKEKRGIKILLYGMTGVGKSWFALTFPKVAVIDTEDGTSMYTENINMVQRLVTTSAVEIEEAVDEIRDELLDDVDTIVLDSETKMYENLQHSALVVVERRARKAGRDAFAETLSMKEWGKIKLIHKRINSKLISLAGMGKNIIMVTQLSDKTQQIGDSFVKIGEKPNGIKGIEYDFDIVLKLCYDETTERRYGIVEKDRTSTYKIGEEIESPSFDNWKHIFFGSQSLETAHINFNKDIEIDTEEFDDDIETLKDNIKTSMKSKMKANKLNKEPIMNLLAKYGMKTPDEITDVEMAKKIIEELKAL